MMGTLLFGYGMVNQNKGRIAAWVFTTLLLASPGFIGAAIQGSNVALTAMWVLIATAIACNSKPEPQLRWWLFVFASACAIGTRYQSFFLLFPMGLHLLVQIPGWWARLIAFAGGACCAGIALLLFSCGDWDRFVFWTMSAHLETMVTMSWDWKLTQFFKLSPLALLIFFGMSPIWMRKGVMQQIVSIGALWLAFGINLIPPNAYGEYSAIYIPALVYMVSIWGLPSDWNPRSFIRFCMTWIAAGLSVVPYLILPGFPPVDWGTMRNFTEARSFLEMASSPGSQVLGSKLEVIVAANRAFPLPLSMGVFSVTESLSRAQAEELGMLTYNQWVDAVISDRTQALVFSAHPNGNFSWSFPTMEPISDEQHSALRSAIRSHYVAVYHNSEYVIFLRKEALERFRLKHALNQRQKEAKGPDPAIPTPPASASTFLVNLSDECAFWQQVNR